MKTMFQTHDLMLPEWGPYTKRYSGISHIPPANNGVRFDLAVFPGLYRRRVDVPNVRYESGYHMWKAVTLEADECKDVELLLLPTASDGAGR